MSDLSPTPHRNWRPKLRWFAAEISVVVTGVLIALTLNAWWQGRQNATREHTYLVQLAQDLKKTLDEYESSGPFVERADRASAQLVQAFRSHERPSTDSLLVWVHFASRVDRPFVVSGTADALVETGDISLISTDSLRSAITKYLDILQLYEGYLDSNSDRAVVHVENLSEHVDYAEALLASDPNASQDFQDAFDDMNPFPAEGGLEPFPLNAEVFLANQETYTSVWNLWRRRYLMRLNRNMIRRETQQLLDQAEAELNR